jgi:hypothetical protein
MCGCDKGQWIDDGRGGYYDNPKNAQPVQDPEHYWDNDRR